MYNTMGNGKKGRRRITRRSSMTRSNTTPDLSRGPFTMADNVGGVVPEPRTDVEGLSSLPTTFEPFPSVANSIAYRCSPTGSIENGSITSTDSKKKHHIFSFKFKDNNRPKSSHGSPHPLSPLPPDTPVKALEMLGFGCDRTRTRSRSLGSQDEDEDEDEDELDDLLGKPMSAQPSPPSLTTLTNFTETDTNLNEHNIEVDTNKIKSFWDAGTKKVQPMLGLRSTKASGTGHEADLELSRVKLPTLHLEEESEGFHISNSGFQACLSPRPQAPRLIAEPPRRWKRKKAPKSLDRMPLITETSHDELRNSYNHYEHNTELELISEYENDVSYFNGPMPLARAVSLHIPDVRYELNKEDLSPSETDPEGKNDAGETKSLIESADEVDFKKLSYQSPATVRLRSPLQAMEDRLLDATEANLTTLRMKQNLNDTSRAQLDAEVRSLKESHRVMREKFRASRPDLWPPEEFGMDMTENGDQKDTVPIRSSIELEEESVVCEAKFMTFTRVTPGMIKLINIPPTRGTPAVSFEHKSSPISSVGAKPPLDSTYCFKTEENPSPVKRRTWNGEPTAIPRHLTLQIHKTAPKTKKPSISREDSCILVRDWASTYDSTKQRADMNVSSNPQIPPVTFCKADTSFIKPLPPSLPPRISSKEHYCIKNGHILHPVNLKTIPDEATINDLQVRPYLRAHVGHKEHVHIPVFCNRCGEDVKQEMWECDVAVCRMVCCKKCAMDMESEWKDRVTGAWKY